jgi:hypothetical protein
VTIATTKPFTDAAVSKALAAHLPAARSAEADHDEAGEPAEARRPGLLPEEFWSARDSFKHIRQAAHAQARSGDVVLYTVLARLSGMIDHRIKMRTGIMGRGSLNLYAALVGAPGAGKSSGASGARALMPAANADFRDGIPIGSGEGIAEIFMGTVDEGTGEFHKAGPLKNDPIMIKVRKQVRHNAYFYVDEGERLTQLSGRQGSTLSETLRSAAMGETLGQTNATEDRNRYVAPGSYSLGLVISYQPTTVTQLLADGHTGTPQRFFWVWAEDPSIPFNAPEDPGPLTTNPLVEKADCDIDIQFPASIRDQIRNERVRRAQGELEVPELDGHHLFMTSKMAALLALLEGRFEVDETDWKLAEMAWGSSCAVRDSLVRRAKREAEAAKDREAKERIHLEVSAHRAKQSLGMNEMRVAGAVARYVADAGPGGLKFNGIKMKMASRDRHLIEEAINLALAAGWVVEDGDRYCVGPEYASRG